MRQGSSQGIFPRLPPQRHGGRSLSLLAGPALSVGSARNYPNSFLRRSYTVAEVSTEVSQRSRDVCLSRDVCTVACLFRPKRGVAGFLSRETTPLQDFCKTSAKTSARPQRDLHRRKTCAQISHISKECPQGHHGAMRHALNLLAIRQARLQANGPPCLYAPAEFAPETATRTPGRAPVRFGWARTRRRRSGDRAFWSEDSAKKIPGLPWQRLQRCL